ncbi:MAG: exodeoxyribonuclease VII small subunit [Clostridia bacterium]
MKTEISFEKSMEKLQEIAQKLENGNLPLDEAMKLYAKGIDLCADCTKELEVANGKIMLLEKNGENIEKKEFETKE